MLSTSRLDLGTLPGSPPAAGHEAPPRLITPALEAEYQRSRLLSSCTLLRATSVLAVGVMLIRALVLVLRGPRSALLLVDFGLVILASLALAVITWSALYERHYLPWARMVVPLRNAIVTFHVVAAAASGEVEVLMALPVMLVGSFFFFGLRLRAALVAGIFILSSLIASAAGLHLPLPIALHAAAFLLAATIACAAAARHLETQWRARFFEERRVADLAQHDALTGTKNRRVFDEHLVRVWQQASEDRRAVAILLIDVDHFKAYNDRYGHLAGDQTLRQIAQTAQHLIHRPLDILARYGGEEFAAILYDMEIEQARDLANRICRAVSGLAIEHQKSDAGAVVTISAGVAAVRPRLERNPRGALQLADQALYAAKLGGRNRIHVMKDSDHSSMVTGKFATPFRGAPH